MVGWCLDWAYSITTVPGTHTGRHGWSSTWNVPTKSDVLISSHWLRVPKCTEYKIAAPMYNVLHSTAPRTRATHSRYRWSWSMDCLLCTHQPLGRTACQTFNRWQPSISSCCRADLECTICKCDLSINSAVVSAATDWRLFQRSFSTKHLHSGPGRVIITSAT